MGFFYPGKGVSGDMAPDWMCRTLAGCFIEAYEKYKTDPSYRAIFPTLLSG